MWLEKDEDQGYGSDLMLFDGAGGDGREGRGRGHGAISKDADKMEGARKGAEEEACRVDMSRPQIGVERPPVPSPFVAAASAVERAQRAMVVAAAAVERGSVAEADAAVGRVCAALSKAAAECFALEDGGSGGGGVGCGGGGGGGLARGSKDRDGLRGLLARHCVEGCVAIFVSHLRRTFTVGGGGGGGGVPQGGGGIIWLLHIAEVFRTQIVMNEEGHGGGKGGGSRGGGQGGGNDESATGWFGIAVQAQVLIISYVNSNFLCK
jgi:hypothetical protein